MLFNSYAFLFAFLPVVLAGWWLLRAAAARFAWLALASYVFYSAWQWPLGLQLLPLLIASTTVDYLAGGHIARSDDPRARKRWLVLALTVNLTLLVLFKYLGFFEQTANDVASLLGAGSALLPVHALVLPIGISFYTFNSMSYTIDIYRRRVQPASGVLQYAAFVAMFPHLLVGPIVRFEDIEDQLRALPRRLLSPEVSQSLYFIVCGLFKKLVIADTLAPTVDALFTPGAQLGLVGGWSAGIGYALQLYFDFSGYSGIAVGLAGLLGFRFPQNFDSPYKARNVQEFWRRWHITLGRWMRDYIFIPLGGSHGGRARTARNLVVTMFLGGLWHGATWAFVAWGLAHGGLLALHGTLHHRRWVPDWPWLWRALTFLSWVVLAVLIRAGLSRQSLDVTTGVWSGMFGLHGLRLSQLGAGQLVPASFVALALALLVFVNVAPNTWQYRVRPTLRVAIGLGTMATAALLLLSQPSPFLYFRF